jgi:hypothetical protein
VAHARELSCEPSLTLLEGTAIPREIDLPKRRPIDNHELEFAEHTLTEPNTGRPDLAARSNHKVGIWQIGCVEPHCSRPTSGFAALWCQMFRLPFKEGRTGKVSL